MRLNGHAAEARELEARIHDLTTELAAGVDHLNDQGIEIKSIDHGLIDFPSRARRAGDLSCAGGWARVRSSATGTRSTPDSRAGDAVGEGDGC